MSPALICVDGGTVYKQYYRDPLGIVYLFSLNRKRSDADVVLTPAATARWSVKAELSQSAASRFRVDL